MSVIGKLARLFGIHRHQAADAIVAARPEDLDLSAAELAVMRRRRILDGTRLRLAKAQALVDAGAAGAADGLRRWQRRVARQEQLLEIAKRRLNHGG